MKGNNILLTYDGLTLNIKQWSTKLGLPYDTLKQRINKLHWPVAKALTLISLLCVIGLSDDSYPWKWAPGMLDPNCTVQKVCVPGYTKTVRPPEWYTTKLKYLQLAEHPELPKGQKYEEDHVVPLEACGNPRDPLNLSPEPYVPIPAAHEKDKVENWYHNQICNHGWTPEMVLNDIQNWRKHYDKGEYCANPNCT